MWGRLWCGNPPARSYVQRRKTEEAEEERGGGGWLYFVLRIHSALNLVIFGDFLVEFWRNLLVFKHGSGHVSYVRPSKVWKPAGAFVRTYSGGEVGGGVVTFCIPGTFCSNFGDFL